jgi:polyisoprenoid-binding protein YceI
MKKLSTSVRRHPIVVTIAAVALAVVAYVGWDMASLYFSPDVKVSQAVPIAPRLTAATANQAVYRIDPSRSVATYEAKEELAGAATTATGTTHGIAGDIVIDRTHPDQSTLGEVVVNVEQLTSDNSLRDKRIRTEYLESQDYPLVKLTNVTMKGLPTSITDGRSYPFTIEGDLTVHGTTKPVTWQANATLSGDTLTADATATVKMSEFGVGPISLIGLVKTGDDVTLKLSLVAPKDFQPPAELTSTHSDSTSAGPSFKNDVLPILQSNCAGCHNPGQLGQRDWTLDTAKDASQVAKGLSLVTETKYMPPWPASDKGVPLQHPRGLTAAQIDVMKRWGEAGGPLDVPDNTKVRPKNVKDDAPTPRDDLELRPAKPYAGDGTKVDDYRCFILDPKFSQTTYMTGYSFVPQHTSVVHHALIYEMGAKARAGADKLDGSDGHPGWSCYGGPGMGGVGGGFGDLVAGWVPGQRALDFQNDTGFKFDPGDFLVLQVHYHYDAGRYPPDQSTLKLQLSTGPVTALKVHTMLAPVEIPCMTGQIAALCDRNAAIADVGQRFGLGMQFVEDGLLGLCKAKVSDFAQFTDGVASSSCTYQVRQNADIVDVLGHMHQTGKAFRMTLNPGQADQKILLDIPRWDFDWQLNYQPVDPVRVKPGDSIRIDCSWDKSLQPADPPRYVVFAEGTQDEMCFSTATFLPIKN